MEPNQSGPLILPALAEYRKAAAWRRATAFVPGPDMVLGITCNPITPTSYSMLFHLRSRFIMGGPIGEGDVRNYLWLHSPHFVPGGSGAVQRRRKAVLRTFERMLMAPWLGIFRRPEMNCYCAGMAMAINDISRLIEDAFADAPSGGSGKPARATLEAQMQALFADAFDWAPERTSATPLRQLYQLVTLINRSEDMDAGEEAILADHLRKLNAPMMTMTTTA